MSTDRYTADSPLLVSPTPDAASLAPRVVRSILINCGGSEERLSLNVIDPGWLVHVPMAQR